MAAARQSQPDQSVTGACLMATASCGHSPHRPLPDYSACLPRNEAGHGRPIRPDPDRAVAAAIHHKAAGCKAETPMLTSRFKNWRNLFALLCFAFLFGLQVFHASPR